MSQNPALILKDLAQQMADDLNAELKEDFFSVDSEAFDKLAAEFEKDVGYESTNENKHA